VAKRLIPVAELWEIPNLRGKHMRSLKTITFVSKVCFVVALLFVCGCETQYAAPQQQQQQQQEANKDAERFLMGGLLGMAVSGAGDIGQPNRDLALRGAASGLQNAQQNDAIRNSGQGNVYTDNNANRPGGPGAFEGLSPEAEGRIKMRERFAQMSEEEKTKMRERVGQMSEEEREKFRSQMRERFIQNRDGSRRGGQGDSSKFGFVNITTDDATFEVFADGAFVGNSPAKLKLSEGPHTIEVRREGFKDYKKEISVTDGSELNLRAVLEKQ